MEVDPKAGDGVCSQCDEKFKDIKKHWSLSSSCDNPHSIEKGSLAMFSGGHDSLVLTHYCMKNNITEGVLHLDTGTGLEENLQFVKYVCNEYEWDLHIYSAKKELKEFAKEWGFPQPASHSWAYRYFKEHTLTRVASDMECEGKPKFYTGVRKDESDRRMRTVTDKQQEREGWIWVSPIMDWSDEDCEEYIDEHDLPRSPVVENIHRSGECYCGAFARRDEELIDLQAHYPDHAEWLLNLEQEVQEEIGTDEGYCWWGSGNEPPESVEALMEEGDHNADMVLCRDCEFNNESEE